MEKSIATACPYDCPDACPFLVKKVSNGSLEIASNPDFPAGGNFICPKGSRWDLVRRHPARLRSPLLRNGSSWVPVSWDDAWSLWAGKTGESISRWGPLSIFFSRGYASLYFSKNLLRNVFAELGGYTSTLGSLCGAAGGAGLKKAFGFTPVMLPATVDSHSRGVLLWGRNAVDTNIHLLPILRRLKERGGSVAAIEIRETATTSFSDIWWKLHPGSDGSLALLLCSRLLERGSAFPSWKDHVANSGSFEKMLLKFDRRLALDQTGLNENDIDEIMAWLLANAPVALYPGYGIQRYNSGSDTFHSLVALSVLLGGLEVRGGGVVFGKDEMALFPDDMLTPSPLSRKMPISSWYSRGETKPPLGVAVFCGANPAKQSPGSKAFAETMARIPFKVCVDLFMTETAQMCDLVLPTAMFLEEGPDWRGSWWHNYILRSVKAAEPPKGILSDIEIFNGLARKMGLSVDLVEGRLKMDRMILGDHRLNRISEGIYSWDEPETWGGRSAVVKMPEDFPSRESFPGGLRLVTVHSRDYINGQTKASKAENEGTPEVRVSPRDIESLALIDGSRVIINGDCGSLEAILRRDTGVGDGFCVILQGIPGVNGLTVSMSSPGYGAPFHEGHVSIKAISEAENDA